MLDGTVVLDGNDVSVMLGSEQVNLTLTTLIIMMVTESSRFMACKFLYLKY